MAHPFICQSAFLIEQKQYRLAVLSQYWILSQPKLEFSRRDSSFSVAAIFRIWEATKEESASMSAVDKETWQ